MEAAIALGLLFLFGLVLIVLCVRMRNKPSMFESMTKNEAPEPAAAQEEELKPHFPKVYIPKNKGSEELPQDTDFEDAMMHLNPTDKVGNPFWNVYDRHHRD